ncbi:hypothetical protein Tco_0466916, partial [Tanacetum coccineum]
MVKEKGLYKHSKICCMPMWSTLEVVGIDIYCRMSAGVKFAGIREEDRSLLGNVKISSETSTLTSLPM